MTLTIKTTRFGEVKVEKNQLYTFASGLIGFPDHKEFALLENNADLPFRWLQSITDSEIAFIVIDPDHIQPEFSFSPSELELAEIGLSDLNTAEIYVVITVPEDPHEMSANLKAPLILNPKKQLAKQIVLNQNTVSTRYYLLREESKQEESLKSAQIAKPMHELGQDN